MPRDVDPWFVETITSDRVHLSPQQPPVFPEGVPPPAVYRCPKGHEQDESKSNPDPVVCTRCLAEAFPTSETEESAARRAEWELKNG